MPKFFAAHLLGTRLKKPRVVQEEKSTADSDTLAVALLSSLLNSGSLPNVTYQKLR